MNGFLGFMEMFFARIIRPGRVVEKAFNNTPRGGVLLKAFSITRPGANYPSEKHFDEAQKTVHFQLFLRQITSNSVLFSVQSAIFFKIHIIRWQK